MLQVHQEYKRDPVLEDFRIVLSFHISSEASQLSESKFLKTTLEGRMLHNGITDCHAFPKIFSPIPLIRTKLEMFPKVFPNFPTSKLRVRLQFFPEHRDLLILLNLMCGQYVVKL